jgi:aldose 1-epimerase
MPTRTSIALSVLALAMTAANALAQTTPAPTPGKPAVEETAWGSMPDGSTIKLFTLSNSKGLKARVTTFGAIIAGIQVPDKDGKFTNVVNTADTGQAIQRYNLQAYTVGRVANRIAGAKFTLDGKDYVSGGGQALHSGASNFGTHNWEGKALPATDHAASALMTYKSKDGDGGFPGNLTLNLTFSLNDDNEFSLAYEATTDKTTLINMTNHAYFNLAGAAGFGNAQANATATPTFELWLDADKYAQAGNDLIPTGTLLPVKDTPLDFTKATALGARSAQLRSYDHAFALNSWKDGKPPAKPVTVARLRDPASGREMEVKTDQPSIQVYTGQRAGVALETQHFPDSIHHDNFPTIILKPGETFKTTTIYAFSAK